MQSDDQVDDVLHLFVQRQVLSGKQGHVPVVLRRRVPRYRNGGDSSIESHRQGLRSSPCDAERCGLLKIRALHSLVVTASVRQRPISKLQVVQNVVEMPFVKCWGHVVGLSFVGPNRVHAEHR